MIELLVTAMLLGIGSGAFALFLDSCMDEGMIFHKYYLLLVLLGKRFGEYWFKPLGLCIYCLSEWCFIGLFTCYKPNREPMELIEIIILFCVGSGFNFLIIDLWKNKIQ